MQLTQALLPYKDSIVQVSQIAGSLCNVYAKLMEVFLARKATM